MNEHTLSDDFSRWPSYPFELLGVPRGASDRDLRRAYARLIRIYKPEQFPEHFRRIREAYEEAQRYSSFYTAFEAPEDSRTPLGESPRPTQQMPASPDAGSTSTPAAEPPLPMPRLRSVEEELDEAWDWAVDGDEARAYARLLDLQNRYPQRSEICLRLHGLLSVAPELDTRRSPCDFLVQGLRQTGGSGPCHELYRREIEDDAAEALSERYAELLKIITQPGLLTTFVQWRFSAAGRHQRFDVLGNDLPGLRARLAGDHEEIWLRLVAFAADQLAWAPVPTNPVGLTECLNEAARYDHLQLRCADVFDRLECLERIAAGWQSLMNKGNVPLDLLGLLSRFWTRPFSEIRQSVMNLLAAIAMQPAVWLAHLDTINEVSPPFLSLFGKILDSYQWTLNTDPDKREPAELERLAQQFLEENCDLRYTDLRKELLAFSLRELIHPDVIAQLALSDIVPLLEARLKLLVNDWPLRHVYRACTLFQN
jgi:hypothetical protein